MSVREILAGKAVVEVGTRLAIERGLRAAEAEFRRFGNVARQIGGAAMAAGAGVVAASAAAVGPLAAAVANFAQVGSDLDDMAQRTGATVEGLSALGYAAKMSGTDLAELENGLKKAQKAVIDGVDGSKSMVAAFARIGLEAERLQELAPEDQFRAIAAGIGAVQNPAERTALAMEIFGKSGTELLPLMQSNINALTAEARELGVVMSTEDAQAAAALGDAIDRVGIVAGAAWRSIGAAVAPAVTTVIEGGTEILKTITAWIDRNRELVPTIAGVAVAAGVAGTVIVALGAATVAAGAVLGAVANLAGLAAAAYAWLTKSTTTTTAATTATATAATAAAAGLTTTAAAVVQTETAMVTALPALATFVRGLAAVAAITGPATTGLIGTAAATRALATTAAVSTAPVALLGQTTTVATASTGALGGAMAAITAPLSAAAAAITGTTAGIAALVAVILAATAYLAYESGVLGEAWGWLSRAAVDLFATVRKTFGGIADALAAGRYVLASRILWAGLRLVFLQGADRVLEVISTLWTRQWEISRRFFAALLRTADRVFRSIPALLKAALTGQQSIAEILAKALAGELDLGQIMDQSIADARAELDRLTAEAAAREKPQAPPPKWKPGPAKPEMGPTGSTETGPAKPGEAKPEPPKPPKLTWDELARQRADHETRRYGSRAEAEAAERRLNGIQLQLEAEQRAKMRAAAEAERARREAERKANQKPNAKPDPQLRAAVGGVDRQIRLASIGTFSAAAATMIAGGADERVAANTAATNALLKKLVARRPTPAVYRA